MVWPVGRALDQAALVEVQVLVPEAWRQAADAVLGFVSAATVALVLAGLLVLSAVRGRLRSGAMAVLAFGVAVVGAEVLKRLVLGSPTDPDSALLPGTGSFPSGHVATVAALGMAAVRVSARRWRAVVGVLATASTAVVAACVVAAGWHRPGDTVAAVLVALLAGYLVRDRGSRPASEEVPQPLVSAA